MRYAFSPEGMSAEELLLHAGCARPKPRSILDSEIYGSGAVLRRCGWYPQALPLRFHTDHGPNQWDIVPAHMLDSDARYFGFYSRRLLEDWRRKSGKPAWVIVAPLAWHRRSAGVVPDAGARGSIFFHAHSTPWTERHTDIPATVAELRRLPEPFQPVSVCLHYHDVLQGRHEEYLSLGMPAFTAGNWLHPSFAENFYEIVRRFRFGLSNSLGSYLFYCVDLGLPFSLIGAEPVTVSDSDPNIRDAGITFREHRQVRRVYGLFSGIQRSITPAQRDLVSEELGIGIGIGRVRLATLLYRALAHAAALKAWRAATGCAARTCSLRALTRSRYIRTHGLQAEEALPTHLTTDEKILLHRTLRALPGDVTCVEIGSYLGASACFVAHAVSARSRVVCIDTWGNDAMSYEPSDTDAAPRDTHAEFRANTAPYRERIVEVRGWSHEVFPRVRELAPSCDFLFIDGDHHHDAVARDWELYSSLLHPGSLVAFHDTGWAGGVRRVVREAVAGRARLVARLPNLQVFRVR